MLVFVEHGLGCLHLGDEGLGLLLLLVLDSEEDGLASPGLGGHNVLLYEA